MDLTFSLFSRKLKMIKSHKCDLLNCGYLLNGSSGHSMLTTWPVLRGTNPQRPSRCIYNFSAVSESVYTNPFPESSHSDNEEMWLSDWIRARWMVTLKVTEVLCKFIMHTNRPVEFSRIVSHVSGKKSKSYFACSVDTFLRTWWWSLLAQQRVKVCLSYERYR